jgi:hypothetical protein
MAPPPGKEKARHIVIELILHRSALLRDAIDPSESAFFDCLPVLDKAKAAKLTHLSTGIEILHRYSERLRFSRDGLSALLESGRNPTESTAVVICFQGLAWVAMPCVFEPDFALVVRLFAMISRLMPARILNYVLDHVLTTALRVARGDARAGGRALGIQCDI